MTVVKICGITEKWQAISAIEAGSDFIGMVFAASPRQVSIERARNLVSAIREISIEVKLVGVFVNMPVPAVNRCADICDLDYVQLSGDETWAYCCEIRRPLIKAIRVCKGYDLESLCEELNYGKSILSPKKHIILLDSLVKGSYGGTGVTSDWNLFRGVAERFPVIIAGGLSPENVAQAVELVSPWGVDVSSGVESNGIKDGGKMVAFVNAVRHSGKGNG